MFLSTNQDKSQINELKIYKLNVTHSDIEFIENDKKINIPLKNILYINREIYFKAKDISYLINGFYKEKFKYVLEKIVMLCSRNSFINENGYVILTSNKIKNTDHDSYFYTANNAILFSPSQIDIVNNPNLNINPIFHKLEEKYAQMLSKPDHFIEQQNFDSSYQFRLNWKSELSRALKPNVFKNGIFVSLSKEGVYIGSNEVNFFLLYINKTFSSSVIYYLRNKI